MLRRVISIFTFILLIFTLSTAVIATNGLNSKEYIKSPIEKVRENYDSEEADLIIKEIMRIMEDGFTEDIALKIYFLTIAKINVKTEDEIKQMFREGNSWETICAETLNNGAATRKKVLSNQEIIVLYEMGYNYSDIKRAQDMYFLGECKSVGEALEIIGKNPPVNKQIDEMLINAVRNNINIKDVIGNSSGVIKDKEADIEKIRDAKERYQRKNNIRCMVE